MDFLTRCVVTAGIVWLFVSLVLTVVWAGMDDGPGADAMQAFTLCGWAGLILFGTVGALWLVWR